MTLQIAQEIGAYCANCNRDVPHTITAMDEGRITGVICGSCKEEHPFKKPTEPVAPPKKGSSRKKAKPKNAQQISDDWKAEMESVRGLSATVYTMKGKYSVGEKLDHHAFGIGLIQKLISCDKMEVLFECGQKLLVCGSSQSV